LGHKKNKLMQRLNDFLFEHIVNLFSADEKKKYVDVVWDILERTYAPIGGSNLGSKNLLMQDSSIWKLVRKNDSIVAVGIYKDKLGRKGIVFGSDGSLEGRRSVVKLMQEDLKMDRSWAEVSGKPEEVMLHSGGIPVPNIHAEKLTGKKILSLNPDGFHYTRMIGDTEHEKMIVVGGKQTYDKFTNL
jgi:hypothetical protein